MAEWGSLHRSTRDLGLDASAFIKLVTQTGEDLE